MRVCSMPGCQTSAGCKCGGGWPWQYPQAPSYTAGNTASPKGTLEARIARLEQIVRRITGDPETLTNSLSRG